jgi:Cu/Ag efflux protein CusF
MKLVHAALAVTLLALAGSPALAQHNHGAPAKPAAPAASAANAPLSEGEVRKIDLAGGKVTLKHGPLANLDMPPMTMAFPVTDRAALEKLKVGDKVRFRAEQRGADYVVTKIEK